VRCNRSLHSRVMNGSISLGFGSRVVPRSRCQAPATAYTAALAKANFYEKALFVKADVAAWWRPSVTARAPRTLCFYSL
jgi:hypothetical protein